MYIEVYSMSENWFNRIQSESDEIIASSEVIIPVNFVKPMKKLAYSSKEHVVDIAKQGNDDPARGKIWLTESKNKITLTASFYTGTYSFPLYEESWFYPKEENKRAFKTYNHIVHVLEDMKMDVEDDELPMPSLQGWARETLRYIDPDRKKPTNNLALSSARNEPGSSDWRESIYGNRYPTINITNQGTININQ